MARKWAVFGGTRAHVSKSACARDGMVRDAVLPKPVSMANSLLLPFFGEVAVCILV
jgi:hypothetical protein